MANTLRLPSLSFTSSGFRNFSVVWICWCKKTDWNFNDEEWMIQRGAPCAWFYRVLLVLSCFWSLDPWCGTKTWYEEPGGGLDRWRPHLHVLSFFPDASIVFVFFHDWSPTSAVDPNATTTQIGAEFAEIGGFEFRPWRCTSTLAAWPWFYNLISSY